VKKIVLGLLCSLLVPLSSWVYAGDITVSDAWIQEAPPTAATLACYMSISNASKNPVKLESASSDDFGAVELHSSEIHEGMVHMRKEHHIEVGAGATLTLKPGALHLMLIDKKRPLKAGDTVALKLNFSDGESIEVRAPVRK
jgi:copper(I)-binding protein